MHYGSVAGIAEASLEELTEFLGKKDLAGRIKDTLSEEY